MMGVRHGALDGGGWGEQKYLDCLFSLPESLRYNFNPIAGSSLGYKHTEETRAKISKSQLLIDRTGANNPMFGNVPANAFHPPPFFRCYLTPLARSATLVPFKGLGSKREITTRRSPAHPALVGWFVASLMLLVGWASPPLALCATRRPSGCWGYHPLLLRGKSRKGEWTQ
jgi:hypothetical protein